MRRDDICFYLSPGDRAELQTLADFVGKLWLDEA